MNKIIALDVGDQWTGIAISDPLCMLAKPHKTIKTSILEQFISDILSQEKISMCVVGNPITLRGTQSEQTRKIHTIKNHIEKLFPQVTWVLWDERLTSKQATALKKVSTYEDKLHTHALAAAFILQSYLDYYQQQRSI